MNINSSRGCYLKKERKEEKETKWGYRICFLYKYVSSHWNSFPDNNIYICEMAF